jgi:hypothetical protein
MCFDRALLLAREEFGLLHVPLPIRNVRISFASVKKPSIIPYAARSCMVQYVRHR